MIQASISTFKDAGVLEDYTIDCLKMYYSARCLRQKKLPRLFHRNINEHIERELLKVLSRFVLPSGVLCFAEVNINIVLVYTLFYFPFCTHGAKSSTFRSVQSQCRVRFST